MAELTRADDGRDDRQLGVVDARGAGATFTGSACVDWAGGLAGDCFAAQGNILVSETTVYALAETFMASAGSPLAERLLACLARGPGRPAAIGAASSRHRCSSSAKAVATAAAATGSSTCASTSIATPIAELERIYAMHRTLFGTTPRARMAPGRRRAARARSSSRLAALGYRARTGAEAFTTVGRHREPRGARRRASSGSIPSCSPPFAGRRADRSVLPTLSTRSSYALPRDSCRARNDASHRQAREGHSWDEEMDQHDRRRDDVRARRRCRRDRDERGREHRERRRASPRSRLPARPGSGLRPGRPGGPLRVRAARTRPGRRSSR